MSNPTSADLHFRCPYGTGPILTEERSSACDPHCTAKTERGKGFPVPNTCSASGRTVSVLSASCTHALLSTVIWTTARQTRPTGVGWHRRRQRLRSAHHAMQRTRAGYLAAVSASRQARPMSYWSHIAHVTYRKHSAADTAAYPARLENLLRL